MKDKAAGKDAGASPKKSSFAVGTTGTVSTSGATTVATGNTTGTTNLASGITNTSAASEPITVSTGEPTEEPKKKDNWVLWGFLGLVGILVGVNVMKNRE
jgi:hypothetical protein